MCNPTPRTCFRSQLRKKLVNASWAKSLMSLGLDSKAEVMPRRSITMRKSLLLFHSTCAYALRRLTHASPRKPPLRARWLGGVLIALLFPFTAHAQQSVTSSLPVQPATKASDKEQTPFSGSIEVNGGYTFDGFKNWSGPSVHGSFEPRNSFNRWSAGVGRVEEFGTSGHIFEGGVDRDLTNTWDVGLTIRGANALFLPRLDADVSASRRWFHNKTFVTRFSGSYVRWHDVHRDYSWGMGASYNFAGTWGVEAGVNIDLSTPVNLYTVNQHVGVSHGRAKKRSISLGVDFGRNAYQVIGPETSISNFQSYGVSVQLRQWVGGGCGFVVNSSYFTNPFYQGEGVTVGFFKEFSGSRHHSTKRSSGR